ncbi:MAG: glycosyltransferase [Spirochaetales bacterium]|nr:glycosyltransferase [Spirochaetales bacterium]
MKIAIFSDTFLPQINGVVTATVMMAKELANQGHEVHVLAPEYKEFQKDHLFPFTVKRFPAIPAFFYEDFKWVMGPNPAILGYVIKNKFHILHFQTPIGLGFQAIIVAKLLQKPLVGTFHTFFADPDYLKHIKLDLKIMERIGWMYSNIYYNRCDVVTVPSQETGAELRTHGCRPPIRFITNGIDLSQFDNTKAPEIKKQAGIKKGDAVFLFIGRLAYEKNLGALIKAFCHAAKTNPHYKLLIVGGGPQEEEYRQLAKKHDTHGSCIFMGKIEHDELVVSGIFGAAKYFITLSKTENQPVTILEAQGNGLIPLCLPEKGLKTMIEHRRTGFFLTSDDPVIFSRELERFMEDKALHQKMRSAIRDMVRKQSITNVAKEWERLYTDLILRKTTKTVFSFLLARLFSTFRTHKAIENRMSFLEEEHILNNKSEYGIQDEVHDVNDTETEK